ncbi:MAG: VCBS repeat-containing protein [Polyangiales bacterium]
MAPPKAPRPAPPATPPPAKPSSRGGASVAWAVVKVLVGLACYALACALAFVVMEHALSTVAAALIVAVGALLVPLALTQLLVPALRRLDPETGFFSTFVGLSGLCAVVTLVALPLTARGPVSRALGDLAQRHPQAGAVPLGAARAASRLLAEPASDAGVSDGGVRDAGVRDAGAARDAAVDAQADVADGSVANDATDAADGSDANDGADAADGDDGEAAVTVDDAAAPDAAGASGALEAFVEVAVCPDSFPLSVHAADLEGDARDEVVVRCWKSLHVYALSEGRLHERVRYVSEAPPPLEAALGTPALFDMNGDRRGDVVLCEHYTSGRGGGRGGVTWLLPNLGDGRWGALTPLDRTDGCGAAAVGDVTGDGRPELLLATIGNPYAPSPNGRIAWFAQAGRAWQRRGGLPVLTWPQAIELADLNHDTILDVVVRHHWSGVDAVAVFAGSRGGLRAVDAGLAPPPEADPKVATARFDDDATPDAAGFEGQRLVLRRSAPVDEVIREAQEAAAPLVPPIARSDAGADDDEDEGG